MQKYNHHRQIVFGTLAKQLMTVSKMIFWQKHATFVKASDKILRAHMVASLAVVSTRCATSSLESTSKIPSHANTN
jgi:hypothetical protein